MTSTYQFQGWNNFSMPHQPIRKISCCLQANNWESLHMQHHGKVTSFPSWILPMLSWFYVQDRYLSCSRTILLSGHVPEIQAEVEVVKIKNHDFSCWAWSTPWEHVLSLKSFCRNPVLSWAIRYSVFQKVKSTSSLEFMCDNPFSTFWHLMVKFG